MTDKSFIALYQVVEKLSNIRLLFQDVIRLDLLVFDTTELIDISYDIYAVERRLRDFLDAEGVD